MRYHPADQDCICPKCDSHHDTVHGFKEHHKTKHGHYPSRSVIMQAQANALNAGGDS